MWVVRDFILGNVLGKDLRWGGIQSGERLWVQVTVRKSVRWEPGKRKGSMWTLRLFLEPAHSRQLSSQ